jgi:hypothetical protein
MTTVRSLITLLTIGTAGAGYYYLQQPPPVGEPYYSHRAEALSDATVGNFGRRGSSTTIQDLFNRVHERARTVLDDVSRDPTNRPLMPADDAFERLRKAMQSAVVTTSLTDGARADSFADSGAVDRVPVPYFDELQRTAFDSSAQSGPEFTQAVGNGLANEPSAIQDEQRLGPILKPELAAEAAEAVATAAASPAIEKAAIGSTVVAEPEPQTPQKIGMSVTSTSNSAPDEASKRTSATLVSNRVTKYLNAEWKIVGMSTEGRPLHTMHLGDSGTRTLVIAGLY